jgi:hypothetical protein
VSPARGIPQHRLFRDRAEQASRLVLNLAYPFPEQRGVIRWRGMHWSWWTAPEVVDGFHQSVQHRRSDE